MNKKCEICLEVFTPRKRAYEQRTCGDKPCQDELARRYNKLQTEKRSKVPKQKQCMVCDRTFKPSTNKSVVCREQCKKQKRRLDYVPKQMGNHQCPYCNKITKKKRHDQQTCGGKLCQAQHETMMNRQREAKKPKKALLERKCIICEKPFRTHLPQTITCGTKLCKRKQKDKWYANRSPEKVERDYQKEQQKTMKLKKNALVVYGNQCVKCHLKNWRYLEFDHVNNDGKADRGNGLVTKRLYESLSKNKRRDDIQILCRYCNQQKTRTNVYNWSTKKNRNELRRKSREQLIRLVCLRYYSGKRIPECANPECSQTDVRFLQLDHIEGDGKQERKKLGVARKFFTYLILNKFPSNLQVLCSYCNASKNNKHVEYTRPKLEITSSILGKWYYTYLESRRKLTKEELKNNAKQSYERRKDQVLARRREKYNNMAPEEKIKHNQRQRQIYEENKDKLNAQRRKKRKKTTLK